jgi:hypothetical protein
MSCQLVAQPQQLLRLLVLHKPHQQVLQRPGDADVAAEQAVLRVEVVAEPVEVAVAAAVLRARVEWQLAPAIRFIFSI